ncbi:MAG: peptide chain release factor family protein [Nevskiales bacterium]
MSFVSTEKWNAVMARLASLGVRAEEFEEQFTRSGGRGGQNVNKVSTCVILTHPPSGLSVRCEEERSQYLNRYRARVRLAGKLEEKLLGEKSARRQAIEKIRRQKRIRSKRAKEKMLANKRHRSVVKERRRITAD